MRLLYSEHIIWLVCAFFYLCDQVRYAGPNALLLKGGRKGWTPLIPHYQFLILNRAINVLNPLTPWSAVLVLPWLSSGEAAPHNLRSQQRRVRIVMERLANIRIAASIVFASLFAVGPIATESTGLSSAILIVAPVLFAMWVCVAVPLILHRHVLTLTRGSLIWILIECAICPGYFANVWRRLLIGRLHSNTDAVAFCSLTLDLQCQGQMLAQLEPYFDDLRDRSLLTVGDEAAFAKYRQE
jgi:hypothetical protein